MLPFSLTIFLSAFLLFQVQPLAGKHILPWFGGSPAVWTTCMLFFQVGLLAGYGYAHWVIARKDTRFQGRIHLLVCGKSARDRVYLIDPEFLGDRGDRGEAIAFQHIQPTPEGAEPGTQFKHRLAEEAVVPGPAFFRRDEEDGNQFIGFRGRPQSGLVVGP